MLSKSRICNLNTCIPNTQIYVTCSIGTAPNANQYQVTLKEQEKGIYDFKWIRCINDILVSVGHPDLHRSHTVSNPKAVKMDISLALSDLYVREL